MSSRDKPKFWRKDWHRMSRIGRTRKKLRKWRYSYGGDCKVKLKERGYAQRPTIGWGGKKEEKGKVQGLKCIRIENMKQIEKLEKNVGVIIGKVGQKKREELMKKLQEKGIKILNRYSKKNAA